MGIFEWLFDIITDCIVQLVSTKKLLLFLLIVIVAIVVYNKFFGKFWSEINRFVNFSSFFLKDLLQKRFYCFILIVEQLFNSSIIKTERDVKWLKKKWNSKAPTAVPFTKKW